MSSTKKKVIYDIGSNVGMNVPYYLKKSDLTVAVEANPLLANKIRNNYAQEIRSGNLSVVNCIVSEEGKSEDSFYIHKSNDVLSQFVPPKDDKKYERIFLPSLSVTDIIEEHGFPYYVKIDVEHYDHVILNSIFESGIYPKYISSEAHEVDVFGTMIREKNYDSFKIVFGKSVSQDYKNHVISTKNSKERYSFPYHSAGPFGEDLRGDWMDSSELLSHLSRVGTGWKDIHARRGK